MNSVAFIFSKPPHGSSAGREGLDAVLATAALSDNVGLFFIGDGVFQLLAGQQPAAIKGRDYIATFGVLPLYDVGCICLCESSLTERGLNRHGPWVTDVTLLAPEALRTTLAGYDRILHF